MDAVRLSASLLASCLALGCSAVHRPMTTAPPSSPRVSETRTDSAQVAAPAEAECTLACEAPQMVPRAPGPDYTAHEVENADAVLRAMTDDLLGCYKKRLRANPEAHGFITIDVLIGDDGHVRNVETTGGAILGESTMSCIVHRVERGVFEPPHGGGTIHVQVPLSLRRVAPGDDT